MQEIWNQNTLISQTMHIKNPYKTYLANSVLGRGVKQMLDYRGTMFD